MTFKSGHVLTNFDVLQGLSNIVLNVTNDQVKNQYFGSSGIKCIYKPKYLFNNLHLQFSLSRQIINLHFLIRHITI